MKPWIIGVGAVLVIGIGGWLLLNKDSNDTPKTDTSQSSTPSDTSSSNSNSSSSSQPAAPTITYSDSGFSPSTVTVKTGDTIAIKNTSSRDMQFDSDPHPAHTDNTELNVGIVAPGQSMTFKVTTTGTYGYHNHLNPTDTGTIVVQ